MTLPSLLPQTCIVRNTAARKGRNLSVTPETTAARHLHYGRIILDAGGEPIAVDPGNRAAPGSSINFLWMMAANREAVDRQFGVVNVQPEFAGASSGLEKGRAGGK